MIQIDAYQRAWIKRLAKARIGGTTERAVLWWLLQYAINQMTEDRYVQKYIEQRRALAAAPSPDGNNQQSKGE
jgi:hypothetical protein